MLTIAWFLILLGVHAILAGFSVGYQVSNRYMLQIDLVEYSSVQILLMFVALIRAAYLVVKVNLGC